MSDKLTTASSKTGDKTHSPANDRRDFIKKGALAAPLIASVASRPVWACSVSGELSGNVSNQQSDCAAAADLGAYIQPETFARWIEVYDFINANPDLSDVTTLKNTTTPSNPFVSHTSSIPVFAVFYWIAANSRYLALPSDDKIPGWLNLEPTTRAGISTTGFTDIGEGMNAGGDLRNTATAILNASHPNIVFPQLGNEWSPAYIHHKEKPPTQDALYAALGKLFTGSSSYAVPSSAIPSDAFQAYTAAKSFLFGD